MAIEEKKYLSTAGVERLIANTRTEIEAAKQAANNYADSLADNYDAAGTAATKVSELANGAVKANADAITEITKQGGTIDTKVAALENGAVKANADAITEITKQGGTIDTKVAALENGQVKTNKEAIGTMTNLETTAKSDLVTAINEVRNAVSAGGTAAAITMTEVSTGLGEGILKAYTIKQGENTVGTINIPKDMVVQSGEVVVNPEGQAAGTYIKLTLANATNDVIYVNVGTLVDIYKAKASAAQVQVAIDSATREISASIVAGSVTATELAADAVTTVKIADGNVTKAKLATDVQASLDKADSAIQSADLGALASKDLVAYTDFDQEVRNLLIGFDQDIDSIQTSLAEGGDIYDVIMENRDMIGDLDRMSTEAKDNLANAISEVHGMASDNASAIEDLQANDHFHSNKTQLDSYDKTQTELLAAAETAAKNYADGLNTAMNTRVEALESVSYVEITAAEIDAMFEA